MSDRSGNRGNGSNGGGNAGNGNGDGGKRSLPQVSGPDPVANLPAIESFPASEKVFIRYTSLRSASGTWTLNIDGCMEPLDRRRAGTPEWWRVDVAAKTPLRGCHSQSQPLCLMAVLSHKSGVPRFLRRDPGDRVRKRDLAY